jgi:phage baseplate assembly protein W
MSNDIQFISVVDNLEVREVVDLEGAVPRTLRVVGKSGFSSAQRVEINDFGIDTFTVVSDKVILAVPGDLFSEVDVSEMDVVVIAGELTGTRSARLVFGPTKRVRRVSGIQKLVQQVVKSFLSDTGSNRFSPDEGGDVMRLIGQSIDPSSQARIASGLAQAASNTQELYLANQATAKNLLSTEKLLKFELRGVQFQTDRVTAQLGLVTFAGQSIDIPLEL